MIIMVKKIFIVLLSIISYIMVWCVVLCGAHHMYFHHDKEAAVGMVLSLFGLCICDLLQFLRLRHKEKRKSIKKV